MKKFMYFFLMILVLVSILVTGCSLEQTVDKIYSTVITFVVIMGIVIGVSIAIGLFIGKKNKKRTEELKAQAEIEIAKLKEMSMNDFLRQNGFDQYCDIFKQNKIEKVFYALELSDSDLMNMGISVLTDRKKLASLLAEKLSATKGPQQRCPKCGSTNYQQYHLPDSGPMGWVCNNCKAQFLMPKIS